MEALLRFVLDHYGNQDMNHQDFRVSAYVIAQQIEQERQTQADKEKCCLGLTPVECATVPGRQCEGQRE